MKFDYKDINLIPRKCIVDSRSECDTSVQFGIKTFKMPVVPANMESIIDINLAIKLAQNGYFYIMHRFNIDIFSFVQKMNEENLYSSISVGVNEDTYELIQKFHNERLYPDYITIDIAHGHSIKMKKMIRFIKELLPDTFLIAGNVSTKKGVIDLEKWGADASKVGISCGSACLTFPYTGFGSRNCQAMIIEECSKVAKNPIISDGGIKDPGDIAKSLVMGATICMIGGMLSGYNESPGNVITKDGKSYKEFWGSASEYQAGKSSRIEGKKILVEYKNQSLLNRLDFLSECLQSSISYGGGKDLSCFKKVKYII